jgi:hypothetical protein
MNFLCKFLLWSSLCCLLAMLNPRAGHGSVVECS